MADKFYTLGTRKPTLRSQAQHDAMMRAAQAMQDPDIAAVRQEAEFAYLTGRSDRHPDDPQAVAARIIQAGAKRRNELAPVADAKGRVIPIDAQGRPLTGTALAIVNAGRRARGEEV